MEYTLETARRLAEELRAIPPKDPSQRRLDKQAMVKELAQEIVALQQRGYTIEEVTEGLRGRGFEITTPTLKNYLQRAKKAAAKGRRPAPKAKPARAPADPGSKALVIAAKAASPQPPAPEPSLRSGKGAFLIKDKESY